MAAMFLDGIILEGWGFDGGNEKRRRLKVTRCEDIYEYV